MNERSPVKEAVYLERGPNIRDTCSIDTRPSSFIFILEGTTDGFVNALREVVDITLVEAGHADTPIGSHINVRLLSESLGLLRVQAGETEHADLLDNMAPVTWSLEVVRQLVTQRITHADDAVGHVLNFPLPVRELF